MRWLVTVQQLLEIGTQHLHRGRLDEAEASYRQVLSMDQNDADAHHLLGLVMTQRGDAWGGLQEVRRAIELRPAADLFYVNYGGLCVMCGQMEEAVGAYRKAVELNPNSQPQVYVELGQALASLNRNEEAVYALEWAVKRQPTAEWMVILSEALLRLGRQQEALQRLQQAIALKPSLAEARAALGTAMEREGRWAEAERCYRDALKLKNDLPGALNNLGHVLNRQQRWAEGEIELKKAIALRPDFAQSYFHLGMGLRAMERLDEALGNFKRAVELNPSSPWAWRSLGRLLLDRKDLPAAIDALQRSVELNATAGAYVNLGRALGGLDRFDEAMAALKKAVEMGPGNVEAHLALGAALQWCGEMDQALAEYRRAIELNPGEDSAGSYLLYGMLFHGGFSAEEIFSAHLEWARRYTESIPRMPAADADLSTVRRLRVGYVSPNFRNQAIMSFMLPVIEHHDHGQVEIFCYSDTRASDAWTARLRQHADTWRETAGLSDWQLAERIRADRVDILIDLTGHIGQGRLRTFAAKPAPVQVTYLGYQATSGLSEMDYFLTDESASPPGAERYFTEKLERIEGAFFCYQPPADAPQVGPLPADARGTVTFGCQNNLAKVTTRTLAVWARVLNKADGSKLMLLAPNSREVDERILVRLETMGVARERIELVRRSSVKEYLDRYNRIDIALDPVPFNGHTTTCDATWMGCPTVMLAGEIYAYRYGGSVLRNVGLEALVTGSEDEYVEAAVALAGDRARLRDIRSGLREKMRRSVILDAAGFARKVESAYRRMWESHTTSLGKVVAK